MRASEAERDRKPGPASEASATAGPDSASEASANVGTKLQLRPLERPTRIQKPRLARQDYVGRKTYHLTLPTNQRSPIFDDIELGRTFEGYLVESAARLGFDLLAYCFMPDHLHALVRGNQDDADLLKLVQTYKQRTGFWFKRISGDRPWQQSFFDRMLRSDEDPSHVADYIFDNPDAEHLPPESPAFLLRGGVLLRSADGRT